jgi:hypothetical protein
VDQEQEDEQCDEEHEDEQGDEEQEGAAVSALTG